MHLVIDCDPGIDDAVAIALAISKQAANCKVEAITVVDGNTSLWNALQNTSVILKQCDRTDIPVYRGCRAPLIGFDKVKYTPAYHIHGERGFGTFVPSGNELSEMNLVKSKSAAEGLIELARENSGKLFILALAPLTNIATAIRIDPDFPRHLAGLFIMGGDYGNSFKRYGAEFNFFKDPEAANIVLREAVGHCPVTMVPFDTCFESTHDCSWDWFDRVIQESTEFGRFLHKLFIPYRHHLKHFACCEGIATAAFLTEGAIIDGSTEIDPNDYEIGVQLEYFDTPQKTEICKGGQRGCLVVEKRKEPEAIVIPQSPSKNDDEKADVMKPEPLPYKLRVVTHMNGHAFKVSFEEAVHFYTSKALPHFGY